jgi:hypothetical protein
MELATTVTTTLISDAGDHTIPESALASAQSVALSEVERYRDAWHAAIFRAMESGAASKAAAWSRLPTRGARGSVLLRMGICHVIPCS